MSDAVIGRERPEEAFDYEPPQVEYLPITEKAPKLNKATGEYTEQDVVTGYRVEPPFPLTGDNLEQLRHFAALVEHRTGLKVRVSQQDGEDGLTYAVLTDKVISGGAPYEVAYAWISGFENGAHALRWRLNDEKRLGL